MQPAPTSFFTICTIMTGETPITKIDHTTAISSVILFPTGIISGESIVYRSVPPVPLKARLPGPIPLLLYHSSRKIKTIYKQHFDDPNRASAFRGKRNCLDCNRTSR
jgi:hypothetical protein